MPSSGVLCSSTISSLNFLILLIRNYVIIFPATGKERRKPCPTADESDPERTEHCET